jgi:tetratricopeptide (TPR) repeat protein
VVAKFNLSKKQILIGVGVILLLGAALSAGALLGWFQASKTPAPAIGTTDKLPPSLVAVNGLVGAGKIDEAQKKVEESLVAPSTPDDEKYLLLITKANLANEKKDYQGAIDALLEADKIKHSTEVASQLGAAYQQIGNNSKAIEYYKKAIQLNPESNPLRERQKEMYGELIRDLGGQP